jgi:hypothetical protein
MTDTFTAALDILTGRGFPNALEIANEIEFQTRLKTIERPKTFEDDKNRLFEIIKDYFPTYCAGKNPIQNKFGETIGYKEQRERLSIEAVNSKSRKQELVMVRQIMMYFLREKSHYGLKQIAYSFGGRDHSTAIHSKDTVINYMDVDRKYKTMVEEIGKAYLERF